ncbi:MAG: MBL fold metallo-hydrolase [Planctomycetia bacterium]|nr:MBL fold metallo-hydrolase [Planctomycetia bacterium]
MNQLAENIDWVGYVDWNVRDFHSYDTARGATYNAYLIRDEKTALIDTVKAPFAGNLLRNVAERLDLDKVDYVVCNHSELDHSGALPEVMAALKNATLLCNAKCADTLRQHFDTSSWRIQIVTPDTPVSLGHRSLAFVNIPMVHWPESMVSYMPEEKILFSNDAFGQHLATRVRFDDQWDLSLLLQEAKSYYANIVVPYSRQVLKTLDAASQLDIRMIAPSHGLIWRKNLGEIIAKYSEWASQTYKEKVLILYDSMWQSTERMAEEMLRGAMSVSDTTDVQLMHVRKTTLTRIATELLDTPVVAIGSATLNAEMMPQMAAVLTYIKGLKFRAKDAVAFGSAGWGPGGTEAVAQWFDAVKYHVLAEPVKAKFRPTPEVLNLCHQTGALLAERARLAAGK